MCERRNDQTIDVGEDLFHRFAVSWRRGRKLCFQIAGLDCRQNRTLLDVVEVIGDPVDQIVAEATKVFFAHVAQFGRKRGLGMIHGAPSYNRSYRTYRTLTTYFGADLPNERVKAIIQPD